MTTSTKDLIEDLTRLGNAWRNPRLSLAAQRLRELDKPDCVWANDGFGSSDTGCGTWVHNLISPTSTYCPNCGGAVKEAT